MTNSPSSGQISRVPVDALHFDPTNPRLPATIDGGDEGQVLRWMLEDAGLTDLMRSIASQGFFAGEPLLVVERTDAGFTVVEGNRRLAALRLLRDPSLATARPKAVAAVAEGARHRPEDVPVIVFDDADDIVDYLGYRHVTGVKQWEPLAKARYIHRLWEAHHGQGSDDVRTLREIADLIGSRRDYVARTLTALALHDRLVDLDVVGTTAVPLDEVDFSLLTVALGYSNIVEWLGLESSQDFSLVGLNDSALTLLGRWLFVPRPDGSTILGESRNMSQLSAIVMETEAIDALVRTESLERAVEKTNFAVTDVLDHILRARDELTSALKTLPKVSFFDPEDLEVLLQINRSARSLYESLRSLSEDEFRDF